MYLKPGISRVFVEDRGGGGRGMDRQISKENGLKTNWIIENGANLDECAPRLWITSRRDHGKQSKMNLTLLDILFVILSKYCILRGQDRCCWITERKCREIVREVDEPIFCVGMRRILGKSIRMKDDYIETIETKSFKLRKMWEWTSENRLGDHRVWGTLSIRSNSHVRANTWR